jgi:hypothetical protein
VVRSSDPVAAISPSGPGEFLVRLAPGEVRAPRPASLELRSGDRTADASVQLLPDAFSAGLSGHLGALTNARDLTAAEAGLGLEAGPGTLGGRLELGYLRHQGTLATQAGSLVARDQLLVFGIGAVGRIRFLDRGQAWAGLGPAAALLLTDSTLADGPPLRERAALLAAQVSLGAGWRAGPGMPFLELRGLWVPMKGLQTVEGSLTMAGLSVGYRFDVW